MKLLNRRREADHDTWDADSTSTQAEQVEPDTEVDDGTGWQTTTANLSGLTRLARIGAWVLLVSGPLLGTAALLSSSAPAEGRPAAAPAQKAVADSGPAGFAQLYVAAYLESGQGTESSLTPYFAGAVALTNRPDMRSATRTVAVSTRQVQTGYWSVTVAAQVAQKNSKGSWVDAGLQYYQVPVQVLDLASAGGAGQSPDRLGYISTSLPAQVAAPAALKASELGYGTDRGYNPADPAAQTVAGFLGAYLAGAGDLDRYTSPGVTLQPVTPAPYTAVEITDVADDSGDPSSTAVPQDGAARQVLAAVTAKDSSGAAYPLTYAMTLRSRDGRWEVAELGAAPQLQSASRPSLAPLPTADGTDSPEVSVSPSAS
ncbi:conjugal transfer protein (plasmid) [Streptomyces sp. NBC_00445]|uniref:conjugal transfer protein n=1 Tax=Streptomyces sp. NBC_00445 TaxID=2975745 RepID=UPI002E1FB3BF